MSNGWVIKSNRLYEIISTPFHLGELLKIRMRWHGVKSGPIYASTWGDMLRYLLWKFPQINATGPHCGKIEIGLGNSLVPPATSHYMSQYSPRSMWPNSVYWDTISFKQSMAIHASIPVAVGERNFKSAPTLFTSRYIFLLHGKQGHVWVTKERKTWTCMGNQGTTIVDMYG